MSTSKTYQQSLADASSETRPPMLERGSYIPWASRFRRYINRKRENQKWLNKALDEGPYEFEMFIPNDSTVPKLQTAKDLQGDVLLLYDAEMELMNLILLSIPNDIYNSVDACTSAKDMWKRVERLMRGTIQNKVDRETHFTNEFDQFVAEPGEALISVYNRFAQLMNDLERNDMHFPIQFEKMVNVSRAKKLEKSHDPLGFDDVNTNSEDPLASAMLLLARAITQKFSTPTNNRLRTIQYQKPSNHSKRQGEYSKLELWTLRTSSLGNTLTVQCYNCSGKGHYAGNCPKPRVRDSKYFMEQMMEEIRRNSLQTLCVNAIISTTDNTSDDGPSYDSAFISENCWTIDYAQINALHKDFVPQKELSAEQKYFPSSFIPSDKKSNATSSIPASMPKGYKRMKVFLSYNVDLCELEKQNDFLKDQLLEVSLKHEVELSVLLNHECVDNSLNAEIEQLKKKSIEIQEGLQTRIKILEIDIQRCEKQNGNVSLDFTVQYLIKERDNVKLEYQKLFNSIKKTRSQTQTEMDELIAHVSEKTYAYGVIRVENQNLLFTISELKIRLANVEKVAEAVATACFTQNRSIIHTRHNKTPYELLRGRKPNVEYFHVFGSLCYPTNNRDDLGKMKPKADIGVFIGYSETSRGFQIYNRRTKKIMETIHVKFDELTTMASEHDCLEPELQRFINHNSSAETINTPSKEDLDNLFGPMYEEYFEKKFSDTPINSAAQPTQIHEDSPSTSLIIVDEHEAPPIVTTSDEQTSPISLTEADEFNQEDSADFDGNSQFVPYNPPSHEEIKSSTTALEPSNVHNFHQIMIGLIPSKELNQFERLQVWEFVPRPEGKNIIALKWLWKNKCDAENIVVQNKTRLVVKDTGRKKALILKSHFASCCSCLEASIRSLWSRQPEGFIDPEFPNHVYRLKKAIYDLKQAPRAYQSQYAIELLKKHGLDECVSMSTPMATERLDADLQGTLTDQKTYRRMIGGLMYLTASRPDIAFATFDSRFEQIAYSDADHAGCKDDCKSTSGGLQFLGRKLLCTSHLDADTTTRRYGIPIQPDSDEHVEKGTVELYFVRTEYQLADLFTKSLPKERFEYLVHRIADVHPDELCPQTNDMISWMQTRSSIWNTLKEDGSKYRLTFMLDKKELSLTLDDFRTIFHLPQANTDNHDSFVTPPSFLDMVPFYKQQLGFTLELKTSSSFKTTGNLAPWQTLDDFKRNEAHGALSDNVVIPVNVIEEEEEITDEVYELKRKKKGKIVEESRSTPFPTPIRSPRIHVDLLSITKHHSVPEPSFITVISFYKANPQLQQQDIAIWLALQMKFESLQVPQTTCRSYVVRPRDQDNPHDEAHPEGENRAKRQNTSEYSKRAKDDYDFWTESYASDDDEIPTKQMSQDIIEEVSLTIDEAKLKKMVDEMLRQRCTSGDEHQYHIDQMKNFLKSDIVWENLLYLKKGSLGLEKIVLSLHKFPAIIFNDDDIEEQTSDNPHAKIFYIRKQKEPGKPKEVIYSNSKIIQVIKTYWELGHEHKFITEIVARRANECIVSITEPDYKNLNKNDIEDMYLLIMNGKVPDYAETGLLWSLSVFIRSLVIWERVHDFQLGIESYQQKVNLTAPTISFPGVEKHKMFSIIYEPVHGIIYKNSKKEKRVMRHSEIHKFCDATLNRVLEGLRSFNNDVKYGYIQRDLTNEEVEYLKLFEEEI
ncbi:retrovirus-related pol polyprotein from transposon TNT 1-94 [Tanacetum coccineum]